MTAPGPGLLRLAVAVAGSNARLPAPLAPVLAARLDRPVESILATATAFGAAALFSALGLAALPDRIGLARGMALGLAVLAAGYALLALAGSVPALLIAQGLAGLGTGIALPAAYALAVATAAPGQAARALGSALLGWTLALVTGIALAAPLAVATHPGLVYGAYAVVSAGLAAVALRRDVPRGPKPPGRRVLLARPGVPRGLLALTALMTAFYLCFTFIGAQVVEGLNAAPGRAGLLPLAYGLGFGLAFRLDPLIDRHGVARVGVPLLAGMALLYLGFAAFADSSLAAFVTLGAVWGVGQHVSLTLAMARLAARAPEARGTMAGLSVAVTYVAVFLGAALGAPLFAWGGFSALGLVAAGLLLVLTVEVRTHAETSI
jgi:predicted MFS family arabinose efflux permease